MPKAADDSLATDLLHGAREIAEFLGVTPRKVFYYVERGQIPVTKLGSLIVASKSALRQHFVEKSKVA